MMRSAKIEAEIEKLVLRRAELAQDYAAAEARLAALTRDRQAASLAGDSAKLQSIAEEHEQTRQKLEDLNAGVDGANIRIQELQEELEAAQQAEADHVAQAARLQYLEERLESDLVLARARAEQAKRAPEVDRRFRVWQAAHDRLNGTTAIDRWTGTTEELEAEVVRLKAQVGKVDRSSKRALERLSSEIAKEQGPRGGRT